MQINQNLAKLATKIDHTLLKPDATEQDIITLCEQACKYRFKAVCVEPKWLSIVSIKLQGTPILPITVISFPHGTDPLESKIKETQKAVTNGAQEIDMVINREHLKNKEYTNLFKEIQSVVQAAKPIPVKVILETSELSEREIIVACTTAQIAGASHVKTSTGFSRQGATTQHIQTMQATIGEQLKIKASGGIKSLRTANEMLRAGADRLGCSNSYVIIEELSAEQREHNPLTKPSYRPKEEIRVHKAKPPTLD